MLKKISMTIYCARDKKTKAMQNDIYDYFGDDYSSSNSSNPGLSRARILTTRVTSLSINDRT